MSQALRKLTAIISKSHTSVVFINQIRMKIGVMFGNPETTTGGNALKFYSTVRLDIRKIATIKDNNGVIGSRTRVRVVKNKVAAPFREAEFDIIYGTGVSRTGELIDMAVDAGVVNKSGSWFSYGDDRLGQGRESVRTFLEENTMVFDEIMTKTKVALGMTPARSSDDTDTVEEEEPEAVAGK